MIFGRAITTWAFPHPMITSRKPLEVLLVEDSPEDIFFFERALKKSSADVVLTVVTDGREAVDTLAGDYRPDLVFLDLKLPLLNGFDILRWARSQNFSPPLSVIVLSGSSHEKDQSLAIELGAMKYLVKPVSPKLLSECFLDAQQAGEESTSGERK